METARSFLFSECLHSSVAGEENALGFDFLLVYVCVLPVHMCVHHACAVSTEARSRGRVPWSCS